jgi:hypothetical protein
VNGTWNLSTFSDTVGSIAGNAGGSIAVGTGAI